MSKFSSLTENRYTLNDIFTKNYQMWCAIPLFLFLFATIIHMGIFTAISFVKNNEVTALELNRFINTGELPGDYLTPILHFVFLISSFIAIIAVVSTKKVYKENYFLRNPDNIPTFLFLVYLIIIVISTVVNKTDFNYILGYTTRGEGVTSLFCYYLIFYLCSSFINKEKIKKAIIAIFLATGIVIGVLTIIDKYWFNVLIISKNGVCGIFYHFNFYGYYLAISIMLSATMYILEKKKSVKFSCLFVFLLNTFIMSINDSLGSFLACIIAFLFLIFFITLKNKKFCFSGLLMFALFMGIIFIVGLFTPSYFSEFTKLGSDVVKIATNAENAGDAGTARWTLWTHTWQYIKEKPWIGWGFEGTAERLGTETHADKAHNEYLENMAYFGIPAGLIYIAALGSVYIKAIKNRKKLDNITICCLVAALGYIGSALVGNSFIFTAPYCFIFLGLGSTTLHGEKKWAECSCCKAKPESCNRQPD